MHEQRCTNQTPSPKNSMGLWHYNPVYKSEDRKTVGNYRGITIQLVISKLYSIVLMTRIERWAIDNNLIPDARFSFRKNHNTADCIFILLHKCQNSRTMSVNFCWFLMLFSHTFQKSSIKSSTLSLTNSLDRFRLLIVDCCEAFDRVCQNCLWGKLGKFGFNEKMRKTLETIYKHAQEGWRSKRPTARPDPNKKWSKTRMPIEPLLAITFYFRHSQTAKRGRVHWSNTWHISNQLPTVCYQTVVVNLAYRLVNQNKSNGFQ